MQSSALSFPKSSRGMTEEFIFALILASYLSLLSRYFFKINCYGGTIGSVVGGNMLKHLPPLHAKKKASMTIQTSVSLKEASL